MHRIVVAGAGLAGLHTVLALRAQGYGGELVLLGAERHAPYDRPPLSKRVLRGDADDTTLEADWDALGVDLRLGVAATGLRAGTVETDAGAVGFDALVVTTGASPVRLPSRLPGADRALTLRTREDALRLRGLLVRGKRVVIVGAGWIGAEVATAAARAGCRVTVVEALDEPLAGALPREVGALTRPWYAAAGAELVTGVRVVGVDAESVWVGHGAQLNADVVVVGIGVRPATGWLVGSGVELDGRGAVLLDAGLRASLPGVFAAGDCASFASRRFGGWLHVEHWDDALHAPAVVAANLLGGGAVHDPVPYFWSEQFGRMLQYAGHAGSGERLLWRGDPVRDPTWAVFWLRGDRLVAALTVDRPRDLVQARRLVERGMAVDERRLADPAVTVRAAVA